MSAALARTSATETSATDEGVRAAPPATRACPHCCTQAFEPLEAYSAPPWAVVECVDCGFVYLKNPPDYEALSKDYAWEKTRAAEKKRRKTQSPALMWLDRATRWRLSLMRKNLLDYIAGRYPGGHVLDVGCGEGRRLPDTFVPFGIEISEGLAAEADKRMRARGGYAVHAPAVEGVKQFPDEHFEAILLRSFLEHEKQPKALLQEAVRVLKPEGAIFIRVPNFASVNRHLRGGKWCGFRHPDHVNYFTPTSLKAMAADCGLKMTLLNPIRLPLDDNINAILERDPNIKKAAA
ncbi:class I SAM-dependent methyltransferase [Methyloligella solikamskensis]|uniref:Class I SAM-dependent methyltransferase n=1 Tax=Methyloligella solikamskensis TaxID=1177756 RepID=A0ABW3J828_9HYPH